MKRGYERFAELLEKKKLTAYHVALECGVSTATLSNWKHGNYKPKADKLMRIADYLQVDVRELLD